MSEVVWTLYLRFTILYSPKSPTEQTGHKQTRNPRISQRLHYEVRNNLNRKRVGQLKEWKYRKMRRKFIPVFILKEFNTLRECCLIHNFVKVHLNFSMYELSWEILKWWWFNCLISNWDKEVFDVYVFSWWTVNNLYLVGVANVFVGVLRLYVW